MYLFFLLLISLIICYLIYKLCFSNKEGMKSKQIKKLNIILLGDYVLHEPESSDYPSIKEMFKANFPLANIEALTSQCKTIEQYSKDITKLSPAKYNNPETYFFVSVGSNDIFTNLVNCSKVFDVKPKEADKPAQKLPCLTTNEVYKTWTPEIDSLKNKFPKSNIILIGAFHPLKDKKIKLCDETIQTNNQIEEDIDTWNLETINYSKKHNLSYIPLDKYITKDDLEKDGITIKPKSIKKLASVLFHEIH